MGDCSTNPLIHVHMFASLQNDEDKRATERLKTVSMAEPGKLGAVNRLTIC